MIGEPAFQATVTEIRGKFLSNPSEKALADSFAIASNQFWWVEDDVYDFDVGSDGYIAARRITDEWGELMNELKERIFEIMRKEGVEIPKTGQIIVLEPFMKKHGYEDGCGWWIKEKQHR